MSEPRMPRLSKHAFETIIQMVISGHTADHAWDVGWGMQRVLLGRMPDGLVSLDELRDFERLIRTCQCFAEVAQ